MNKLSRFLAYNIQQILTQNKGDVVLHDVTNLFWMCRGLFDSIANTRLTGKKQNKLEHMQQSFVKWLSIQSAVAYIADTVNREDARVTAKKLGVDLAYCESFIVELYLKSQVAEEGALTSPFDAYMTKIDGFMVGGAVTHEQKINLLAYLHALRQIVINA